MADSMTVSELRRRFERGHCPEALSGCWLWHGTTNAPSSRSHRYGVIVLGRGRARKRMLAHRVSYLLFVAPPPRGLFVCHRCDVTLCVNPDHLFLGTARDNMVDCRSKGRMHFHPFKRGAAHPLAKLTAASVGEIRRRHARGEQIVHLARDYAVHKATVGAIIRKETWTHV